MLSHRKLSGRDSLRYHSEDNIGPRARPLPRGTCSNQGNYANTESQVKTLAAFDQEVVLSKSRLTPTRDSSLALPRINAKLVKSAVTGVSGRVFPFRCAPRKQTSLFKSREKASEVVNPESAALFEYLQMTHEGGRVRNEDRVSIHLIQARDKTYQFFGVFDGHGGHLTSNYLAVNLHLAVRQALVLGQTPKEALGSGLKTMQDRLRKNIRLCHKSGSCAVVVLVRGRECWGANVGDSRVLWLGTGSQVLQLTQDHKPELESERKRIEYNGGEVYRNLDALQDDHTYRRVPFRVYPGKLSVTRTIGDIYIKRQNPNIIIPDPELFEASLAQAAYLVLLSDGMYEGTSNNDIARCILSRGLKGCEDAFALAGKTSQDNRSLVVIKIQ